ncbi:MAG: GntR family transcriptional regulator [Rhodospirillales bacterium]|nr:MAG: GntR family transcriptional regulator [Rhodospirillales bacterium]
MAAPLRQQVVDHLREAIIAGRIEPGQRLIERELTDMLAVSRTVIREALRQLETEGLIVLIPNKGPVVRELSPAEAHDVYRIRSLLEGLAARLFAENADEAMISQLEAALDDVIAAYEKGGAGEIMNMKNKFYDILYRGVMSETLTSILVTLNARIRRWRAVGLAHPKRSGDRSRESVANLGAMLRAIRNRDADTAERITREEAEGAAHEVLRLLGSGP